MSTSEPPAKLELLTFQLAEQEYSLDIMSVREIRSCTQTTILPHAPDYMKGVINLRGTVLPVMDLAVRLGLPTREKTHRSVIIVIKHEATMTGLLVDAVSDIITVTKNDLQTPPDTSTGENSNPVSALTFIKDGMVRILDLSVVVHKQQVAAA